MEVFALQGVRSLKASPKLNESPPAPPEHSRTGESWAKDNEKMKSMKMFLFSAALLLVASSNVHATEALLFNGGGYTIEVLIGFLDDPVIAQVHFTPPGAKGWVSLPRDLLRIEKFDMKKSILTMHFSNKNNLDLPASFSLSANKTKALLSISGKEIKSEFNWDI